MFLDNRTFILVRFYPYINLISTMVAKVVKKAQSPAKKAAVKKVVKKVAPKVCFPTFPVTLNASQVAAKPKVAKKAVKAKKV